MRGSALLPGAIFFLSGAAALVYQVVWTKQLAQQFGVTAHAVSTTLAVFMLGLAAGSWYFGRLADRVRRPLVAYAWLELGIAAGALASQAMLRGLETVLAAVPFSEPHPAGIAALRVLGVGLVLLVPGALMGGTLPMLAKELVAENGRPGRQVGWLYGSNALGGAVGCVGAGFFAIGELGLRGTLLLGVGGNVVAAALAFALARWRPAPASEAPAAPDAPEPAPAPPLAMHVAFGLAGLTGLAVEVGWMRLLLLEFNGTAQAFAAMVAVCLTGLAAGSLLTARLAERVHPARGYALAQGLVGLAILGSAVAWAVWHPQAPAVARQVLGWLPAEWRGKALHDLCACLFQCSVLLLLPTLLMGAAVPFAGRGFGGGVAGAGRRLGAAFTENALGSMLGPLLAGFWLLPWLGLQTFLVVCAAVPVAAGSWLSWVAWPRGRVWLPLGLAAAVGLAWPLATGDFLLSRTVQRTGGRVLAAAEDACGSVAVREITPNGQPMRQLLVGVTSMITDGFNCRRYTRLLGHLPLLLHERPKHALVICLGSGMTLSALAAHEDLESITCVELSPAVVRLTRQWFDRANGGVLGDPRVRLVVDDGRSHLRFSDRSYDVITLEPPPPNHDGVAALYSREFYELCRARLRPGGLLAQWIPYHGASLAQIRSMLATVRAVFPHATLWEMFDGREYCVVARLEDGVVPLERVAARLAPPRVRAHLREIGVRDAADLFACFVAGPRGLDAFVRGAPLVTDDRPGLGYDFVADNLVNPGSASFEHAIQVASLATAEHAEHPATCLSFADEAAERTFRERLDAVRPAARMHLLAVRLCTLRPGTHEEVFRQPFTSPRQLDPGNAYYEDAEQRGVYRLARSRQQRAGR